MGKAALYTESGLDSPHLNSPMSISLILRRPLKLAISFCLSSSAVLLVSCEGTRYISDVTRFHRLPPAGNGETFTVTCFHKDGGQLETSVYSSQIVQELEKYGWRYAGSGKAAKYRVGYDYGISSGRTVHGTQPIFGQTGGGTTFHSGTVRTGGGYGSYSGTSTTMPTFGIVGAVPTQTTVFDRYLFLVVKDGKSNVLETRTFSSGSSSSISRVLPYMITSTFTGFPGASGKTETVEMAEKR